MDFARPLARHQFLSPFRVCVCALVEIYVRDGLSNDLAMLLVQTVENIEDAPLSYLHKRLHLQNRGSWVSDRLLAKLMALCESPDALYDFFTEIRDVMVPQRQAAASVGDGPAHIDRWSILGLYVRQQVAAFEQQSFDGLCRTFEMLLAYKAAYLVWLNASAQRTVASHKLSPAAHARSKPAVRADGTQRAVELSFDDGPGAGGEPADGEFADGEFADGEAGGVPPSQSHAADGVLGATAGEHSAILQREKRIVHAKASGAVRFLLPPDERELAYARLQVAMENRDVLAATEQLHRYYDYALVANARAHATAAAAAAASSKDSNAASAASWSRLLFDGNAASDMAAAPKTQLPYAALALASLHVRLGHPDEALQALHETVRVAQHAGDASCLTDALFWLQHLYRTAGDAATARVLLARCAERAAELGLDDLAAVARLRLAAHAHEHPNPIASTVKTDALARCRTQPALIFSALDRALPGGAVRPRAGLAPAPIDSAVHLLRAAVWEHAGGRELARLHVALLLQAGTEGARGSAAVVDAAPNGMPGVLAGVREGAASAAAGSQTQAGGEAAADRAAALGRAALFCSDEGCYTDAVALLRLAKSTASAGSVSAQQDWLRTALQVVFDWALLRGDVLAANVYARTLVSLALTCERAAALDATYCETLALAATGAHAAAVHSLQSLVEQCAQTTTHARRSASVGAAGLASRRVLFLLGLSWVQCDAGAAGAALPYALEALALCGDLSLDALRPAAAVQLARVRLALGLAREARDALDNVGGLAALDAAPLSTQGLYFSLLAQATASCEGNQASEQVLALLAEAETRLSAAEATALLLPVLRQRAAILDRLGRIDERNATARKALAWTTVASWPHNAVATPRADSTDFLDAELARFEARKAARQAALQ